MIDDNKFRSRRFVLASSALAIGSICALIGCVGAYQAGMPSAVAEIIQAFSILATGVLGAYGYTRSKWGAADDQGA